MDAAIWTCHCVPLQPKGLSLHGPKSQDHTDTETRGFQEQDQDQDSEVQDKTPRFKAKTRDQNL